MSSAQTLGVTSFSAILGIVIARLRKDAGIGQDALAKKLNITASTLSRMENGESAITIDQLYTASKALEVEPHKIIKAVEEMEASLNKVGIRSVVEKSELLNTTRAVFKGASLSAIGSVGAVGAVLGVAAKELKAWRDDKSLKNEALK